ncbi:hypothetical protein GN956_G1021 [Arapaima gigas]
MKDGMGESQPDRSVSDSRDASSPQPRGAPPPLRAADNVGETRLRSRLSSRGHRAGTLTIQGISVFI